MATDSQRPLTIALGWRLPRWLLDIGPVAVILLIGGAALARGPGRSAPDASLLVAGLLVSGAALLLRHRAPLGVLAVVLVVGLSLGYGPIVVLPVMLAVFTVAEYTERSRVIAAVVAASAVVVLAEAVHGPALTLATVLSRLVAVGLAVAVGLYLRARADYIVGLRERAERLQRERELLAQQAVGEERVRIARELHDVVAHNVSLMVVQAQAVAATSAEEPEREALARVADLGRDALSEMHRMLGVLRLQNGGAPDREPQPGVRDLDGLVARTREAGLQVRLLVRGQAVPLPAAVDLSVYRIVQEALTNVIRHACAREALVALTYDTGSLAVTVIDDGRGPGPDRMTGGHGLVGMHERVALFGGDLRTGGRADGDGYRVHAILPVG